MQERKKEEAIRKYGTGEYSLEQAADFATTSIWEFVEILRKNKVALNYDKEKLERDIKTVQWLKHSL